MQDLYVFDPVSLLWTNLSDYSAGEPPSSRFMHGFAAVGHKLYVQGGLGAEGAQSVMFENFQQETDTG